MTLSNVGRFGVVIALCAGLAACGARSGIGTVSVGGQSSGVPNPDAGTPSGMAESSTGETIFDAFGPSATDQTVAVNRYLWNASLDVLNFLPIQTVDPFTGVIVTGYGTPPGGGRAYRATIHVTDPALEARALRVSLQTRNGPVSDGTARAVEDAILARARQMRIADDRF